MEIQAMIHADISTKTSDFDTLGGRLGRARDAKGATLAEIARLVGVEARTLRGWECDRASPRSNKLAMLSGILGVSTSWLLFGRGTSPSEDATDVNIETSELRLDRLKIQQQKVSSEIDRIEQSLRQTQVETDAELLGITRTPN